MTKRDEINKSPLNEEQLRKLKECKSLNHELKEENGFIHCLTEDLVIGPSR